MMSTMRVTLSAPDSGRLPRSMWYVGVLTAVFGSAVGLARLTGHLWTGHYHKILVPLAMLVATLVLLQRVRRLRVDPLGSALLVAIPWGVAVGIVNEGNPRYFLAHIGAGAFCFLLYAASRNTRWDHVWLERFWFRASDLILVAFGVSIGLFWLIWAVTGVPLYLGLGADDLLFAMSFYLVKRRYLRAALVLVLIFMAGKRGTLLAIFALLLFYLPMPGKRSFFVRAASVGTIACALILGSFMARPLVESLDLPIALRAIFDKWYLMDPFGDNFSMDLAVSGRNQELILAFGHFSENPLNWVSGMGYGWSYWFDAVIPGSDSTNFRSHYVHLSPANLLLLYGLPLALAILSALISVITTGYRCAALAPDRPMLRVLTLFCIGTFVSSLSGYMYATTPWFWLALGTLASMSRNPVADSVSRGQACAA